MQGGLLFLKLRQSAFSDILWYPRFSAENKSGLSCTRQRCAHGL